MDDTGPQSTEFLVEITVDGSPAFILCSRTDGPFDLNSVPGLPRAELDQLFREQALRAVPLPNSQGVTEGPEGLQSGRSVDNH